MPTTPLSGSGYDICSGPYTASIAAIGASLRILRHDGRDLVVPFDADELRPAYRGAVLAPWPNRIIDGQYSFDGSAYQLPLTEPERANALHGLLSWEEFRLVSHTADSLTLAATVVPQAGYPFRLEVIASYSLTASGLDCAVSVLNLAGTPAPYGCGPHPYLVAGAGRVDDWTLELPADEVLLTTPDRLAPTELVPVGDVDFDFRSERAINDIFIDHAFTGLHCDADGVATVTVLSGDSGVRMTWLTTDCRWVQVHTADVPADASVSRIGLAVEPMTCPPDAFNSGTDLIVLEPGGRHTARWTIAAC